MCYVLSELNDRGYHIGELVRVTARDGTHWTSHQEQVAC